MRDYRQQVAGLRGAAKGLREINMPKTAKQMEDAADAIEELLAAVPHWISVEERLPEPYQNVLTCAQKLFGVDRLLVYGIDYTLDNGEWACGGESYKTMVTHWMPLPEPPKEATL
jgi:hypothetical protein